MTVEDMAKCLGKSKAQLQELKEMEKSRRLPGSSRTLEQMLEKELRSKLEEEWRDIVAMAMRIHRGIKTIEAIQALNDKAKESVRRW